MGNSKKLPAKQFEPRDFNDLLSKAFLLKEFAVKNGYEVDPKTIQDLNALRTYFDKQKTKVTTEEWEQLDKAMDYAVNSNYAVDEKVRQKLKALRSDIELTSVDLDQLNKAIDYAVNSNYAVDEKVRQKLKFLTTDTIVSEEMWDKLDSVIVALTSITFPTTMDDLSGELESDQYKRFKGWLFGLGIGALIFAILGFVFTFVNAIPLQLSNSILALSLGLLGAIIYSLFNVLRVVPPQAFNPKDEYSNYARLLLGVLLGWVFYFAFAIDVFKNLKDINSTKGWKEACLLLMPFVAGYSTKFVVGILNRVIAALEIALGIEDKRDISARRVSSRRS